MTMNCALTWQTWSLDWLQKSRDGQLSRKDLLVLAQFPFLALARSDQRPPPPQSSWRNWLLLGGRGAGKTRAGAEWTRFSVLAGGCERVALVGPTLGDVREVMIEGPSGLRAIEPIGRERPVYHVSRRRLEWPNGAIASVFSAEDADSLRGPQFDAAWCDEVAAWPDSEAVWDTLQMGLRLGDAPRCVATTTPRPTPLIRRLVNGEATVSRGRTSDNAANLSAGFLAHVERQYGGTVLARQELDGELIEDVQGALWTRSMIEAARVVQAPDRLDDLVVAIDPPATSHDHADTCGIIAVGLAEVPGYGRKCYVLADASVQGLRPLDWGARVSALAARLGASRVVAEANQGGEMIAAVLESAGCAVPVRLVHARLGKRARAMPVAALYGRGEVAHVGRYEALEDEMCRFGTQGFAGSPDRVDALVWAVSALLLERSGTPRVRRI